jgi:hypothetical protein
MKILSAVLRVCLAIPRRNHTAQDEKPCQLRSAKRRSFAVVHKVFRHGKAEAHHPRVNDSINDTVELVVLPPEEDEEH